MSIKKKIGGALLGTALGAALIGGGTFAIFTDTASNAQNTFTSGTIDINLGDGAWAGAAHVDIANLAPGDSGSKTVTVKNDGSLELRYDVTGTLAGALASNDPNGDTVADPGESNPLVVTVTPTNGGALTDRVLAPNTSETFTISYSLPKAAGNTYQAKSATYDFKVDAEQTRNNP